jgi:hypothetical protein
MPGAFSKTQLVQTYLIATVSGVALQKDYEELSIDATFPGVTQFLSRQMNMPASCTEGVTPISNPSGFSVSADARLQTGGGYQLLGRVGQSTQGKVLTGTGYKLRVRK